MMSFAKKHLVLLSDLLKDRVDAAQCLGVKVSGLTIDSRAIKAGDCFVALKGTVTDGAHYIQQAVSDGAVAVIIDDATEVAIDSSKITVPVVRVTSLSEGVSSIAGRFYNNPSDNLSLVAFTGTNGKTTCSRLYAQLVAKVSLYSGVKQSAYMGTTGYGIALSQATDAMHSAFESKQVNGAGLTTPDAVSVQRIMAELLNNGAQSVALEASSHSLVQHRLKALQIETAVFTNLSRDHLDYHYDLASYAAAKASLFDMPLIKTAVINLDDPVGSQIIKSLRSDIRRFTFSLNNQAADIYCSDIRLSSSGISAMISTPWGSGELCSALLGEFNLSNLLAIIGVACSKGASLKACLNALPCLEAVPGRMEALSTEMQPQVVVDYAHTPDALEKALQALKPNCEGKLWVIFGCGGNRDTGKRSEMGRVAERFADTLVVTSDNPRNESPKQIAEHILQGITGDVQVELDRKQAIAFSIHQADPQDIVLIAGKGHENYQIIGDNKEPFSDQKEALKALKNTLSNRQSVNNRGEL